jgi:uncharacterized protein (TIGR00251 family)
LNAASTNPSKLMVKVLPNASRNEILGLANGVWRIKIAAPPEKGKANKELIEFLSEQLEVRKDNISILRGHTSHNKLVVVIGLTQEDISRRLSPGDRH